MTNYILANQDLSKEVKRDFPWNKIIHTPAIFAVFLAHFCGNSLYYTLLFWVPTYIHEQVHTDTVTFVPYIGCILVGILSGKISGMYTFSWLTQ